jgi:phage terminase Nu1 subunit (DNA packaging protein)
LWTRPQLAYSLGVSKRTIRRYELAGLPVVRRGQLRLYDVEVTRRWLLSNPPQAAQ